MTNNAPRAVVLAAGKGTRMKSEHAKVLHKLCGRAMLWYVLRALRDAGVEEIVVVCSLEVAGELEALGTDACHVPPHIVIQVPQLGTGHAVQIALTYLKPREGTLLVLNGDMPSVDSGLIAAALRDRSEALRLVTARMPRPSSYGRIVRDGETVSKIVEARDATPDELELDEMNAGLYAYDEAKLRAVAEELTNDNAQGEYYLTDTVGRLVAAGERVVPLPAHDYRTVLGVNDRVELAAAAALLNLRLCEAHMRAGVTIADPATTYLEPDLEIASDVVILPNTTIGRRSQIGSGSEVGPNTRLSGATIGRQAVVSDSIVVDSTVGDFSYVGPWAHLRNGAILGTGVRVGNFVEIKASVLEPGVKTAHLAYIGDASLGERTNVGAGTITANFDGAKKNRTTVGKDVSLGTNTSLIAPVSVGDGALTGAGSVVTHDVPAGERVAGNPARPLPKKP
jgi:bifunctional UDP-N-acetylglucosamine pyrophosphorylase / glucosamine-1-phosphate N-acetyltransferase